MTTTRRRRPAIRSAREAHRRHRDRAGRGPGGEREEGGRRRAGAEGWRGVSSGTNGRTPRADRAGRR